MRGSKFSILTKYMMIILGLLFSFFMVIFIVIQIFSNIYVDSHVKKNIYVQQDKVDHSLDILMYDSLNIFSNMYNDEKIINLKESIDVDNEFKNIFNELVINPSIYQGMIMVFNDQIYKTTSNLFLENDDYDVINSPIDGLIFCGSTYSEERSSLILGHRIVHPITKQKLGAAYIFIDQQIIYNLIKRDSISDYSMIIANDNYIVSHQEEQYIGKIFLESNQFSNKEKGYEIKNIAKINSLVVTSQLKELKNHYDFGWKIVTIQSYNNLLIEINNLKGAIFGITIAASILAIFIGVTLANRLVGPIKKLSIRVENYNFENINSNSNDKLKSKDEIYLLEVTYDKMVERIFNLLQKNRDDMEVQRKLELDSLQMQINPHFLYNTLDAIAWLAKIKKQVEIENIIMSLAQFFRITLHNGDKFITVGEEIELIKKYLDIEKFRFPERFEVYFDVDERIIGHQTLKLILQPVVENAIKHGLAVAKYRGHIYISVKMEQNNIIYQIKDDGVGFAPPADILVKDEKKSYQQGGYGLINVNERIKLEYGEGYGLTVESSPNQGTLVTIIIAVRES